MSGSESHLWTAIRGQKSVYNYFLTWKIQSPRLRQCSRLSLQFHYFTHEDVCWGTILQCRYQDIRLLYRQNLSASLTTLKMFEITKRKTEWGNDKGMFFQHWLPGRNVLENNQQSISELSGLEWTKRNSFKEPIRKYIHNYNFIFTSGNSLITLKNGVFEVRHSVQNVWVF